jgi:hypothetical protein
MPVAKKFVLTAHVLPLPISHCAKMLPTGCASSRNSSERDFSLASHNAGSYHHPHCGYDNQLEVALVVKAHSDDLFLHSPWMFEPQQAAMTAIVSRKARWLALPLFFRKALLPRPSKL